MRFAFRFFLYRLALASDAVYPQPALDEAAAGELRDLRQKREPRPARPRARRGGARDRRGGVLCRLQPAFPAVPVVAVARRVTPPDAALRVHLCILHVILRTSV